MSLSVEEAKAFLERNIYFDIHGHKEKLLPPILRVLSLGKIPKDVRLSELKKTGVNGFVVCAVGDPNSFGLHKKNPFLLVMKQLRKIKEEVLKAGGVIALTAQDITCAVKDGKSVFILGIEGGDFLGEDIERLSIVYKEGVRFFGPLHYSKNQIGSISYGWGGRIVPEEEQTGLTVLGETVIKEAQRLGIIVDLTHSDEKTITDILSVTVSPLVCSHTGPYQLHNFPRYISDKAIQGIAATGGLIGMWPFFHKGLGMKTLDDFLRYTQYVADLAGMDHVAIGTDINGVPGNMEGYKNLFDAWKIIHALSKAGFSGDDIKKITGLNFIQFLESALK